MMREDFVIGSRRSRVLLIKRGGPGTQVRTGLTAVLETPIPGMITDAGVALSPLVAVTPVAELLDESWVGWRPIELGSSLGRGGALIEQ